MGIMDPINIEVDRETTWPRLNARKLPGESFDDVITGMLDDLDAYRDPHPTEETDDRDDADGDGIPLRCQHCDHEWRYGGSMDAATCPSCKGTVPVDDHRRDA